MHACCTLTHTHTCMHAHVNSLKPLLCTVNVKAVRRDEILKVLHVHHLMPNSTITLCVIVEPSMRNPIYGPRAGFIYKINVKIFVLQIILNLAQFKWKILLNM